MFGFVKALRVWNRSFDGKNRMTVVFVDVDSAVAVDVDSVVTAVVVANRSYQSNLL